MIAKVITYRPDPIDVHDAPPGWYEISSCSQLSVEIDGGRCKHYDNDIVLISGGCVANITRNFIETLESLRTRGSGVTRVLPLGMTLSKLEMHMDSLATNPETLSEMQVQAATPPQHARGFDMPIGST
jgi:hypothetical protein